MKIIFVSNFMNHHQMILCDCLCRKLNGNFIFIATEEIPKERLDLGYADLNKARNYIVRAYEVQNRKEIFELCNSTDVLIIGSASDDYIKNFNSKKLIFRYSERPYKNHTCIRALLSEIKHHYRFWKYNIRILCASAYTAGDHAKYGMYKKKCYKWGYFPEVKIYSVCNKPKKFNDSNNEVEILWAGRMLSWKHPEVAVKVAQHLKDEGYHFHLNIIGSGEMEESLKKSVFLGGLNDKVNFLGTMPPEKVRKYMESADIFLFTSDRNEGWGAVLNEAMNSQCAVVANYLIGSVPFMIEDGINGFFYKDDFVMLLKKTKLLIENKSLRKEIQENAYNTVVRCWNPEIAAERLITLIQCIQKDIGVPYSNGPCSYAEILREK